MDYSVLVSVQCYTYNQVHYIAQCLEGIINQITSFPYEIIVHDDASNDGTVSIIKEYANKFPSLIRPIFESVNLYQRHDGELRRVVDNMCRGKYIAICEGDDYWTDSLKLQRQVDFLESHEDYSMCFHSAYVLNENNAAQYIHCESIEEKEYFTKDIFPQWIIPTASVLFRHEVLNIRIKHPEKLCYNDIALFLSAAKIGRLWGMNKQMSVYRINSGGVTQTGAPPDYRAWIAHEKCLRMNFPNIERKMINRHISSYYYSLFKNDKSILKGCEDFFSALIYSPHFVLNKCRLAIIRLLKNSIS